MNSEFKQSAPVFKHITFPSLNFNITSTNSFS